MAMSGCIEPASAPALVRQWPTSSKESVEIMPTGEFITPNLRNEGQLKVSFPLTTLSTSALVFLHDLAKSSRGFQIALARTAPLDPLSWIDQAMPSFRRAASAARVLDAATGSRRVERLTAIQAALGGSLSDVAKIFRISRQWLYKWLDKATDVRLQEASRARFDQIESLMQHWRGLATRPLGELMHEPLGEGATLIELLSAEALDEARVRSALDEIAQRVKVMPKSPGQRLAAKGFVRRPTSLPSDD
jgi:transposase-like protein